MSRAKHNSRLRQTLMSALDACLLRGSLARLSYRVGLHGKLRVSCHELQMPAASPLPASLLLAFASDFHAGPTTHPDLFKAMADELRALRPDLILLGGDYTSSKPEYIDVLCESLAQCRAPLGIYAVLGNHDLWAGEEHIKLRLSQSGARVLINESVALPAPFNGVSVCGIDDPWTGEADVARTFRDTGPIRIFLTHSPDGLLFLGKERFDVGFAGHTHGGQIALRDGTPIVSAGGPLSRIYARGRFELTGNGPLIVSRGVGCSSIPVRINADPEIVVCTLRS
jgi:predicted MPP superfamily phosphohydrolase